MNTALPMFYIGWPQAIILVIGLIHLGIHLALHGKRTERTYNALAYIFYVVFMGLLLFWGGFFNTAPPPMMAMMPSVYDVV